MTSNNNHNTNTDSKTSLPTKMILYSVSDEPWDFLREKVFNMEGLGIEMPEDFYKKFLEGSGYISDVIFEYFFEEEDEYVINFDEVVAISSLGRKPKNTEELSDMVYELHCKRWYYEYLHWCGQIVTEGLYKDGKHTEKINSTLEIAEKITKKYGQENLHIRDFSEFGFLYGKVATLDWVWYLANNWSE